jgi:integrase
MTRAKATKRNRIPGIQKTMTSRGETRWKATVDIGEGGVRKQLSKRFLTQGEADAWRTELLARKRRGEVIQPSAMPLAEWFADWIALREQKVRASSALAYRTRFARIAPLLGTVPLARLTPMTIERAYMALAGEIGPTTLRNTARLLSMLLSAAVRDGKLPRNPCAAVKLPGHDGVRRDAWSLEQARRFTASLGDGFYDDLWRLLLETWLRAGEARALRWSDLDLAAATLTVQRTATPQPGGGQVTGPPKSRSSHRTLSLSVALADRLKARKHAAKVDAFEAGEGWSDARLVFPGHRGEMLRGWVLSTNLRRACELAGVPVLTVHGLRHAGGSIAHNAGVPLAVISARLGHADPSITARVYMTHDADQADALGDQMAALLA